MTKAVYLFWSVFLCWLVPFGVFLPPGLPARELLARELPARELPARELPARELSPREIPADLHHRVYRAYLEGDLGLWATAIERFEAASTAGAGGNDLFPLVLARYGYIGALLGEGEQDLAREHLARARQELATLMDQSPDDPRLWALRGAFSGFRILLRPLSALRFGPEASRSLDRAMELDPREPLVWLERANALFHRPAAFGGSKESARESYGEAVRLFEENLEPGQEWLYLNSLIGLARSLCHIGDNESALAALERALAFEPDLGWVREKLLPALAGGYCQGDTP
ncbi:hypothetical protein AU468_06765 [Alkalispirochaeta sphaeroplastigenens]|uniref:Uncharacterized protein n=1 Tax=Alkalispirochaeta sphaeroplastigenens TaxID=1187066 RepID=A0A2S4JRY7_9SPIO|nr:hypothetical protein [Alkalispirochaeta sphaeroplastigenens]POR02285.1 hypothetical protein AU468_06765 [Alkalispirochaeta sphaeroplastigenens]